LQHIPLPKQAYVALENVAENIVYNVVYIMLKVRCKRTIQGTMETQRIRVSANIYIKGYFSVVHG